VGAKTSPMACSRKQGCILGVCIGRIDNVLTNVLGQSMFGTDHTSSCMVGDGRWPGQFSSNYLYDRLAALLPVFYVFIAALLSWGKVRRERHRCDRMLLLNSPDQ